MHEQQKTLEFLGVTLWYDWFVTDWCRGAVATCLGSTVASLKGWEFDTSERRSLCWEACAVSHHFGSRVNVFFSQTPEWHPQPFQDFSGWIDKTPEKKYQAWQAKMVCFFFSNFCWDSTFCKRSGTHRAHLPLHGAKQKFIYLENNPLYISIAIL